MQADQMIESIIEREGGYVNDENDSGGCTKYGITKQTLSQYRGKEVTCSEVSKLTKNEARKIYRNLYVEEPGFDQLQEPLRSLIVDSGVQHGTEITTKWLQEVVGVTVDGIFGPKTKEAVESNKHYETYYQVLSKRIQYYGDIISNDHSQAVFASGWMKRVNYFVIPIHRYMLDEVYGDEFYE